MPDAAKPDKFAVGAKVHYPKSHAKPPTFTEGEGEVTEVVPMNKGRAAYRVKDAAGNALPVLFEESELRQPKNPPKPPNT